MNFPHDPACCVELYSRVPEALRAARELARRAATARSRAPAYR